MEVRSKTNTPAELCSQREASTHVHRRSRMSDQTSSRKQVRFSPKCRARLYKLPRDSSMWYADEDYDSFQEEAISIVFLCGASNEEESKTEPGNLSSHVSSISCMGLEHRIDPVLGELRRKRREHAFDAVWSEQYRQYQSGEFCDETLAAAYQKFSLAAQDEARERAMSRHSLSMNGQENHQIAKRLGVPRGDKRPSRWSTYLLEYSAKSA